MERVVDRLDAGQKVPECERQLVMPVSVLNAEHDHRCHCAEVCCYLAFLHALKGVPALPWNPFPQDLLLLLFMKMSFIIHRRNHICLP